MAESDVAVIRAQSTDAKAALLLEQTLLDHHSLIAPYDAVVVQRHAEPGTVMRAGDVVFTLMDPATVWLQTYMDESRAGDLARAKPPRSACGPCRIRCSAEPWRGSVSKATG